MGTSFPRGAQNSRTLPHFGPLLGPRPKPIGGLWEQVFQRGPQICRQYHTLGPSLGHGLGPQGVYGNRFSKGGPKSADSTTLWGPPWATALAHRGSTGTGSPMGALNSPTVPHFGALLGPRPRPTRGLWEQVFQFGPYIRRRYHTLGPSMGTGLKPKGAYRLFRLF